MSMRRERGLCQWPAVVLLYARYQERLKALNACDFGDLLLHMLTILRQHPTMSGRLSARVSNM
jgi:superfamily I DNA/RNA helicase